MAYQIAWRWSHRKSKGGDHGCFATLEEARKELAETLHSLIDTTVVEGIEPLLYTIAFTRAAHAEVGDVVSLTDRPTRLTLEHWIEETPHG